MLEILEINTAVEMDDLWKEWDDLLGASRSGGIFQTWEWVSCCWQHFSRGKSMVLICVRADGRLVGLAPMEITRMYGLPLRRLQFIGTGVSDYLDFVLDEGYENTALAAIVKWITSQRGRWDLVDLQQFPQNSPSLTMIADMISCDALSDDWHARFLHTEVCPYLPLAESWADMNKSFGKKMRFNLGYYERLMNRDFDKVSLGPLSMGELDEGMDAFFDLHTARWRKRWMPGMLAGADRQAFHREVAALAHKRGWLRLHGLRLDGKLQSVLYCFTLKEKGYYYLGGFEPTLAKYSPGTVLTGFAVKDAIAHGCREFDFLRGNERYKARWTKAERMNHRLVMWSTSRRSKYAKSVVRLERKIEQRVKEELHKRIGAG